MYRLQFCLGSNELDLTSAGRLRRIAVALEITPRLRRPSLPDLLHLLLGQPHFPAPGGEGRLLDWNQVHDLAVGESEQTKILSKLGTLPSRQRLPQTDPDPKFGPHLHGSTIRMGWDRNGRAGT